jgi:hypothetical protein
MWQVGLSFNCNNPSICNTPEMGGTGGDWGWAEFDRSADGTQTWGDAQTTFCFHTIGGGGAGAGHTSFDITSWTISAAGTFVASGTETDTFRGMKETHPFTNEDTGIPATPGHYNTTDVLGFTAPGVGHPDPGRLPAGQVATVRFALPGLHPANPGGRRARQCSRVPGPFMADRSSVDAAQRRGVLARGHPVELDRAGAAEHKGQTRIGGGRASHRVYTDSRLPGWPARLVPERRTSRSARADGNTETWDGRAYRRVGARSSCLSMTEGDASRSM